jgi:hypothetical protein
MVEDPVGSAETGPFATRKHVNKTIIITVITVIVVFMKALLLLNKCR